mmetsp:Transcript_69754/g.110655  ORF Transcript_69754/g.110655 Transcript_69754/m.110655 type:complete len:218 (-) Transcript_69754:1515-2168(-)
MNMQICAIQQCATFWSYAKLLSVCSHPPSSDFDALHHDVPEFPSDREFALTFHSSSLYKENVASNWCVCQPDGNSRLRYAVHIVARSIVFGRTKHVVQVFFVQHTSCPRMFVASAGCCMYNRRIFVVTTIVMTFSFARDIRSLSFNILHNLHGDSTTQCSKFPLQLTNACLECIPGDQRVNYRRCEFDIRLFQTMLLHLFGKQVPKCDLDFLLNCVS